MKVKVTGAERYIYERIHTFAGGPLSIKRHSCFIIVQLCIVADMSDQAPLS